MVDLKLGRIGRTASLVVIIVAFAPAVLLAQTVDVHYKWAAPHNGAPVDHYNVYHIVNGGSPTLLATSSDTTYTLEASYGVDHQIQVSGVSATGREGPLSVASDPVNFEIRQTSGDAPSTPSFRPNFPNPFNPQTTIVYGVPQGTPAGASISLEIYDLAGHRVRRLEAVASPGWHTAIWDGTSDAGDVRPSGQYVVRLVCDGAAKTWKMTMLK